MFHLLANSHTHRVHRGGELAAEEALCGLCQAVYPVKGADDCDRRTCDRMVASPRPDQMLCEGCFEAAKVRISLSARTIPV